jgi:tripartite ATP-independent transporter DctM subunit
MERKGYNREFSVAVTTTAATTGLIIPPSNIMIVYAVVAGQISVAAMFMAGVFPGILVGLGLMTVCFVLNRGKSELREPKVSWRELANAGWGAAPSMLLMVIVLCGILAGAFSPTEAAAIAVLYSFILAVLWYREIAWRQLPEILLRAAMTTSVVMLLIGTSQAMSWLLAHQNIPQSLSASLLGVSDNPIVILMIINLVLLVVGTFMDMTPAVLIFTPILLPVVVELGMHPVHFGIMMIANLCIGLCTPPVGTCLFVGCGVGKTSIANVTRPMLPFFLAMLVSLIAITYFAPLCMWLPRLFGLD